MNIVLAQIKNRYITDIWLARGEGGQSRTNCQSLMAMQDDPVVFICDILIAPLLSVTVIAPPLQPTSYRMMSRVATFAMQLINFHSSCYKYKLISVRQRESETAGINVVFVRGREREF